MKTVLLLTLAAVLGTAAPPHWSTAQVDRLIVWMTNAGDDGLTRAAAEVPTLRALEASGDQAAIDAAATQSAEQLLSDHISGCGNASLRTHWRITNGLEHMDRDAAIAAALQTDGLDGLFSAVRPTHPFFLGLQAAYSREQDPGRKAILAANLDRWRWMPRHPGSRYLLVNVANFEVTLWQDGKLNGRWAVIVGRTNTPTPVFAARATAVTINPWWVIPPAIARESVVGLMARNPAAAARRGYVRVGGEYRQRPGPFNALGRMKLVMPNPYHVYLHDTPARALFAQDTRAFSHGCVRVNDALGLASALLGSAWDRVRLQAAVDANATRTIVLGQAIPVYVAYFTAEPDATGAIRYFPDVYRRDRGARAPIGAGACTG